MCFVIKTNVHIYVYNVTLKLKQILKRDEEIEVTENSVSVYWEWRKDRFICTLHTHSIYRVDGSEKKDH